MQGRARQILTKRRRLLIAESNQAEKEARALLQQEREPDWEDQAQLLSAAQRLDGMSENERAQLAVVEAALDRIESGTWGRCAACGRKIDERRLRAVPEAVRCIGCTH
jgi:DnaK suppressor protein